jgi:hypothetical protein
VSCSRSAPPGEIVEGSFAEVFPLTASMPLKAGDSDPIGKVSALHVWNGTLVVVDEMQANLKLFDTGGRRIGTIGRAGDGPGEFRAPFSAATLPDGRLAVLDRARMVLSFFGPERDYQTSWFVPAITPGGVFTVPDPDLLLVPAKRTTPDSDPELASSHGMHLFTLDGHPAHSFRALPEFRVKGEESFSTLMTAVVGATVISSPMSRNELHHHHLRTGREWTVEIGSSIYRAPKWPKEQPRSIEEVFRWADEQMWVMGIVPLDSAHYAVKFTTYPEKKTVNRYVIADTAGRTLAVTDTTRFDLKTVHDGTVYGVRWDDDGNVELGAFAFRLPSAR